MFAMQPSIELFEYSMAIRSTGNPDISVTGSSTTPTMTTSKQGVHALHFKCYANADERLTPFCQGWLDRKLVFSRIMDLNCVKGE